MKELDPEALALARHMNERAAVWQRQSRARAVLFWIDGDANALAGWSKKHKLGKVRMAVVSSEQNTYAMWRIHQRARSTTVLLRKGGVPTVNLVNLSGEQGLKTLEGGITEHLQRAARCRRD